MTESHRPPKWVWIGFVVFALAGVAGFSSIVTTAIERVASGQGSLTYRTAWLYELSYSGVLVMIVAAVLAVFVGAGFWLRESWLWRDFERKYGGRSNNA
jgi:hypothetical protein